MFQPIYDTVPTPEQREISLRLCEALGLDPHSVKAGTFEAMAWADDTVRVRWVGMASISRSDFIAAAPEAPIV